MTNLISRARNSNFRHNILPIRSNEFPKFFPMALLMFTILLNQNIVRIMKDGIVMTMVGPEVISFVKLWCEMPAGILFVIIYSKMCNMMTTEKAFRIVVIFFLSFFTIFAFVLFPNCCYFHPDPERVQHLVNIMPHFKWFVIIWSKWSYIMFYVMGELWPIIVFVLLFWQLANKITKTEEASRFYSFFSLFGQTNLLISGSVVMYFKSSSHFLIFLYEGLQDKTEVMVKSLVTVVVITGVILLAIHYYIEKRIMSDTRFYNPVKKKEVLKLGIIESLKTTMSSKYLWLICSLMICYGMAVNLIEGVWMSKVRDQYSATEDFMSYMGTVYFWTGVFTLICSFLGSAIIKNLGWYVGAVVTPLMIMIAGGLFFVFVSFENQLEAIFMGVTALTPLAIITFVGGAQNVLGKGTKYSLFDATKEMAYIPLNDEMKTKGKAAVDVIGNKIGKSSGAIVQFVIFSFLPGIQYGDIAGYLGVLFIMVCLLWIWAVKNLSKEYKNLIK